MNKLNSPLITRRSRIGFHYFPDTLHYTDTDLQKWLPELCALKASWLVLISDAERAIPERFITGLVKAGIEPIIHFNFNLANSPSAENISAVLSAYAAWGVRGVIFFDRPNARGSWPSSGWIQQDLVERFIDLFLPLAEMALSKGINPIFPPLEPGGSYWDTAFLRSALVSLENRKQNLLLQNLVLSAYAWNDHPSLDWGAGGPQRWPGSHPYFTPPDAEDQRGFRVFDWYTAVTQAVLQKSCPMILLGVGSIGDPMVNRDQNISIEQHTSTNNSIVQLLSGKKVVDPGKPANILEPIPDHIVACNFWLLAADKTSVYSSQAWFQPDGQRLPILDAFQRWLADPLMDKRVQSNAQGAASSHPPSVSPPPQSSAGSALNSEQVNRSAPSSYQIDHYLLLPSYEWGIADWHLDVIRPFVKKYHPTIGFSLEEALFARRVTVIGNRQTFPEDKLNTMRAAGCLVERISGDGTSIATQLAER